MVLSRLKVWANRNKLTHTELNAEFNNLVDYIAAGLAGTDLATPLTMPGNIDMDGHKLLNVGQYAKMRVVLPNTSIQTKIDELESSEGSGIVVLVPGTYDQDNSGITLPIGISLVGPGMEACVITSTVAGSVITIGDATSDTRSHRISGFKITAAAANTKGITVTGLDFGTTAIRHTKISDIEIDGTTASSITGLDLLTNTWGLEISSCHIHDCAIGVLSETSRSLFITRCQLDNDTNVKLISAKVPRIVGNHFLAAANAEYHIDMDICIGFVIEGNYITGAMTTGADIFARSGGSTDILNNLAGTIRGNYFNSVAGNVIKADGLRGCVIEHNYMLPGYIGAAVTWGAESKANEWRTNWCRIRPWIVSDPTPFIAFGVDMLEESRPLGGGAGTSPTTPRFRPPVYSATPDTTNWGADEKGTMWIVDDGVGAESWQYWTGSAVTTVAFT